MIDKIERIKKTLETILEDGGIICYQKYDPEVVRSQLGRNTYTTFCSESKSHFATKFPLEVTGFALSMSEDLGSDQMARLVG